MSQDFSNPLFSLAASYVNHTSRHVFLTGRAGTGKTTFLKYIKDQTAKNTLIVAPTGVAAINAGGVTAHSLFQLPLGAYIPGTLKGFGTTNSLITDRHSLFRNMKVGAEKRKLWQEMELLIIDEVSMLRADMLDAIDQILRAYRRKPSLPFGGVQVLYIGDLHQLPPVVSNNEWELLREHYQSPFFFDSLVAREAPPVLIELKKIYRQSEKTFIRILNNIRNNQCDYDDMEILHGRYLPEFRPAADEGYILLTSHNNKADAVNRERLEALAGRPHHFEAIVTGDFSDKAYPAEQVMELKEGAQVMFIKNDKGDERRYYNGKIGTIRSINENGISVGFADSPEVIVLERETWKNIRYKYNEKNAGIEEEEMGSFSQFPVRLAWAITIHKSQGLTFEKAIVDAGASFAPGQVYVALSRLTSLNGLVLHSRIEPRSISTDPRVVAFNENELSEMQLERQLEDEQQLFLAQQLVACFEWSKLRQQWEEHHNEYATRAIGDKEAAVQWSSEILRKLGQLEATAAKFRMQLQHIIPNAAADGYVFLHQRTEAAANYFLPILQGELFTSLQAHFKSYEAKTRAKKYLKDLSVLDPVLRQKEQQLQQAMRITAGLVAGERIGDVLHLTVKKAPAGVPLIMSWSGAGSSKESDTKLISLEMFLEGKSVSEIAAARGMVAGTIEGHLLHFIKTGELPLEKMVPEKKVSYILAVMNEAQSRETGLLKNMLGDEYSYNDIRAVQQHLLYKEGRQDIKS